MGKWVKSSQLPLAFYYLPIYYFTITYLPIYYFTIYLLTHLLFYYLLRALLAFKSTLPRENPSCAEGLCAWGKSEIQYRIPLFPSLPV